MKLKNLKMKKTIDKIHSLNQDDYELFLKITTEVKFKKGELILREGDLCKGIYYIDSGTIGLYKMYNDRKYFQDFFFEESFATNIISISANKPSEQFLIAIDEVNGKFISKQSLIKLYEESVEFKEFGRRLLEQLLANQAKLSFIRSSLTSKEKYEYIINELPHYVQRIPLQALASYLGMTRETLSRMRNAMQK